MKASNTSVQVGVNCSGSYANGFQIERLAAGGSWTLVHTGSWSSGTVHWTDTNAPAGQVTYRARATRPIYGDDSSKGVLYSAYTTSNQVMTATPPLAPTITAPANGSAWPTGSTVRVAWTPNHPDGSGQSAAQGELTNPDGTTTTIDLNGTATSTTVTASVIGKYSFRVRTKGVHADWGEWSTLTTVTVADPPNVVITGPLTEIQESPFTVAWSVLDDTGVSEQSLEIVRSGNVVFSTRVDAGARSLTVTSGMFLPLDGDLLTFRLTVRGGSTLSSTVSSDAPVLFVAPPEPRVSVTYDDAYAAHLTVLFGSGADVPPTRRILVYRVMPDASELLLDGNLSDGQSTIDRLPPLNTDYSYRIVAQAESGAVSDITQEARVEAHYGILNFGRDASVAVTLGFNMSARHNRVHASSEMHFARGDNTLPVSYSMRQLQSTATVRGLFEWDSALYSRLVATADAYTYAWYREPSGLRWYAKVDQEWAVDTTEYKDIEYAVDLTQLAWEEPVR